MITLSFDAIFKDEAQNLLCCFASIKLYVKELMIVDTDSTNEMIAIIAVVVAGMLLAVILKRAISTNFLLT
jgi:hypothetical protein